MVDDLDGDVAGVGQGKGRRRALPKQRPGALADLGTEATLEALVATRAEPTKHARAPGATGEDAMVSNLLCSNWAGCRNFPECVDAVSDFGPEILVCEFDES